MLLILEVKFRFTSSARTTFFFQVFYFDYTKDCDFEIQFSAGVLTLTSVCQSQKRTLFDWKDSDPLDIMYYRFGSRAVASKFHVHTGKALVFSFLN